MPNRIEYIELICGLSAADIETCTIGPSASPAEIKFICQDASVRLLFVDAALEDAARAAVGDMVEHIICVGERYEDELARASATSLPALTHWEKVFCVPYTSGATGRPKGVMLAHRGRVLSAFAMAAEHAATRPWTDRVGDDADVPRRGVPDGADADLLRRQVEILPRFDIGSLMAPIADRRDQRLHGADAFRGDVRALGAERSNSTCASMKAVSPARRRSRKR